MVNGTTEAGDFFDDAAAEEAIFRVGGQKDGFNLRREGFVRVCHLQFHFKIRDCSQSTQQDLRLTHSGIGDG